MRDSDIRLALDALLRERHDTDSETVIRHEVGICAGKRRIDVAVINSEIIGYEIKSDEDTLNRLNGQAEVYGAVLDKAVLVTTKRHLDGVLDKIPEWWGVIIACNNKGNICLKEIREPGLNNRHDAFSLAQLLWKEEALTELRLRNKSQGLSKKARHYVWAALTETVSLIELRSIVRSYLKARQMWPGGQPRVQNDVIRPTVTS